MTNWNEKLHAYLKGMPLAAQRAFASGCDTKIGQLKQIVYGKRRCNPVLAVNIDRESLGQVPMEYMAPEVDWDYVRRAMLSRRPNVA